MVAMETSSFFPVTVGLGSSRTKRYDGGHEGMLDQVQAGGTVGRTEDGSMNGYMPGIHDGGSVVDLGFHNRSQAGWYSSNGVHSGHMHQLLANLAAQRESFQATLVGINATLGAWESKMRELKEGIAAFQGSPPPKDNTPAVANDSPPSRPDPQVVFCTYRDRNREKQEWKITHQTREHLLVSSGLRTYTKRALFSMASVHDLRRLTWAGATTSRRTSERTKGIKPKKMEYKMKEKLKRGAMVLYPWKPSRSGLSFEKKAKEYKKYKEAMNDQVKQATMKSLGYILREYKDNGEKWDSEEKIRRREDRRAKKNNFEINEEEMQAFNNARDEHSDSDIFPGSGGDEMSDKETDGRSSADEFRRRLVIIILSLSSPCL